MIKNLKIIFNLDGTGVYYDPYEPIHLDALIAWALAPFYRKRGDEPPARDEQPIDFPLPFNKWYIDDSWGWKASALFPEGETGESLQYWRKKFRQNRVDITKGSPNLQLGIYREYNTPMPLLLCKKMSAYTVGDPHRILDLLRRNLKYLGKKRSYGKGKIISIEAEEFKYDFSLLKDGMATRFLPDKNGSRIVRTRPPYWNIYEAVPCCEIGSVYNYARED